MVGRHLCELPPELLEQIFGHLDVSGMLNAQVSCKQFLGYFSIWNKSPIPSREIYIKKNINRANYLLEIAKNKELRILLLGNRSMQANIISRPKYFFPDAISPNELDEDLVNVIQYKMRIFSSLHDGFSQAVNINEQITQSHLVILCVSTESDYKIKLEILKKTFETMDKKPLLFIAKPLKSSFQVERLAEKVIELEADYKRDRLAQIIVTRLGLLGKNRSQEMAALTIDRSYK